MNRIQGSLFPGGALGVLLVVFSAFAAPPSSVAQQPRPTLTPTPEIVTVPNRCAFWGIYPRITAFCRYPIAADVAHRWPPATGYRLRADGYWGRIRDGSSGSGRPAGPSAQAGRKPGAPAGAVRSQRGQIADGLEPDSGAGERVL